MRYKLLKLSKFLKQNGFDKLAGDLLYLGGSPLERIIDYIAESIEDNYKFNRIVSPAKLGEIYGKIVGYLVSHKDDLDLIVNNHLYDELIKDLDSIKSVLKNTKEYFQNEAQGVELISEDELKNNFEESMKKEMTENNFFEGDSFLNSMIDRSSIKGSLGGVSMVDSLLDIFQNLTDLKTNEISNEKFKENVSEFLDQFKKDTAISDSPSESINMLRRHRERRRGGLSSMLEERDRKTPKLIIDNEEKEKKEEEELRNMELPDEGDVPEHWGWFTNEDIEEHASRHGEKYDPENHPYPPEDYPPGFFDD